LHITGDLNNLKNDENLKAEWEFLKNENILIKHQVILYISYRTQEKGFLRVALKFKK